MMIPTRHHPHKPFTFASVILAAALMTAIAGTAAWAAGSSATSNNASESAYTKRQKANIHFQKGVQHQEKQRFDRAARAYEKAITIDAGYAEAYSNLGYCYRKQGKMDRAIRTYQRAITLKPDLAEAHEYIGEAYAEMGRFDKAERHLGILKRLDPEQAEELAEFIRNKKS